MCALIAVEQHGGGGEGQSLYTPSYKEGNGMYATPPQNGHGSTTPVSHGLRDMSHGHRDMSRGLCDMSPTRYMSPIEKSPVRDMRHGLRDMSHGLLDMSQTRYVSPIERSHVRERSHGLRDMSHNHRNMSQTRFVSPLERSRVRDKSHDYRDMSHCRAVVARFDLVVGGCRFEPCPSLLVFVGLEDLPCLALSGLCVGS